MKIKELETYIPKNEQEKVDREAMLSFAKSNDDCLQRSNLVGHFTSSALIVNDEMDEILFVYHNIYDSWSWVGGHNDGERDFLAVALKEAKEETGVQNIRPFNNDILMIDVLPVGRHVKRGTQVGHHLHLNLTYLMIADRSEMLVIKPDENSGVKWFKIDEVLNFVTEEDMKEVYKKGFEQIAKLGAQNL